MNLFSIAKKKQTEEIVQDDNSRKIYELINRRRRQMLIHSIIYYRLDANIIDDTTFNVWGRELLDLQTKYPEISKMVPMYEAFKNWDATTGYDLPMTNNHDIEVAKMLIKYEEVKNEK
ncbi:hypothetical protein vBCtySFA88_00060 [Clostridium phage vB_CtyS-FA88]|nr:hypothetical protein vBCtySFA88_00060 [Clostridium phage vB_CtyS-FA88]